MKLMRSTLSLAITFCLVALSPGGSAWAQLAQVSGARADAATAGLSAAGAVNGSAAIPNTTISIPTLSASLVSPVVSVLNVAVPRVLPTAAVTASRAASVPAPRAEMPVAAQIVSAQGQLTQTGHCLSGSSSQVETVINQLYDSLPHGLPFVSAVFAAKHQTMGAVLARSSKKNRTPDSIDKEDGSGRPVQEDGGIDEIGNPRRSGGEGGPDDRSDPDGGRGGDGLFGAVVVAGLVAAGGAALFSPLLILPLVLVSLILHEIGHAKAAAKLGDPTATLQGRAGFNPLRWGAHVDLLMTVVLPLATFFLGGFILGGAKPVPVDAARFKNPAKDMAKVAFAGPAVNLILAVAGALAYAGAVAGGLGAVMLGALVSFIFLNAALAVFNLLPVRPLDGGHILAAFLPSGVRARLDSFYARLGAFRLLPIIAIAVLGGGFIVGSATVITQLLIGASLGVTGVQLAGAALPAMAALGMLLGRPHPALKPAAAIEIDAPSAADFARPVDLVVLFSQAKALVKDLHLSQVDPTKAGYVQAYEDIQQGLLGELSSVGLDPETLASYNATPVGSYRRINAATIRVDAAKAPEFEAMLRALGHQVYNNDRRKIITPVPVKPEDMDPSARGAVTMEENLAITRAAPVQAIAVKRWGKPEMNPWRRLWRRVRRPFSSDKPSQPLTAVIDSGADVTHPLLKRVKEVKNVTSGRNVDDIGHGTWVTSMGLNFSPWAKNVTHYKTFVDGGATLDDILKALTAAANDGNLVISNSWGDDDGDPESPDSKLVLKLAQEGHIMVFAAGNAGSGKNTIGAPAIVSYRDAQTGAVRVLAVAASDRNKKTAYFSSRGAGSFKTRNIPGYPHRPDLMAVGYNTEGAWPAALGGADRIDPEKGALKDISGTSMSTPSVWGAILLLMMMFGVTEKGAKLDAVVSALMGTLEKTGKNGPDDEGEGFLNVEAAYRKLLELFGGPKA